MTTATVVQQRDRNGRIIEADINRDWWDVCFVIVDDDGEPVSDFIFEMDAARTQRAETEGWDKFRIFECGYRVFADEPELIDDPLHPAAGREELAQMRADDETAPSS